MLVRSALLRQGGAMRFLRGLRRSSTPKTCVHAPLMRVGQGDFTRDIHPEQLNVPTLTAPAIDL